MGRDRRYICQKASVKADPPASISLRSNPIANDNNSSSDEDEDDELASTACRNSTVKHPESMDDAST